MTRASDSGPRTYGNWRRARGFGIGSLSPGQTYTLAGAVGVPLVALNISVPAGLALIPVAALVAAAMLVRIGGQSLVDVVTRRVRFTRARSVGWTELSGGLLTDHPRGQDLPGQWQRSSRSTPTTVCSGSSHNSSSFSQAGRVMNYRCRKYLRRFTISALRDPLNGTYIAATGYGAVNTSSICVRGRLESRRRDAGRVERAAPRRMHQVCRRRARHGTARGQPSTYLQLGTRPAGRARPTVLSPDRLRPVRGELSGRKREHERGEND
jgi:hypothetical protein